MDQEQILFHRDRDEETPLKNKEIKTYIITVKENRSENSTKKKGKQTVIKSFQMGALFLNCKKVGNVYFPSIFSTKTIKILTEEKKKENIIKKFHVTRPATQTDPKWAINFILMHVDCQNI